MFAEIVLGRVNPRLDKVYHYSIPESLANTLDIGHQVMVPFGKSRAVGYVVGLLETSEVKGIKDIEKILSPYPLFNMGSVSLARWMSEYYNSFFITALRTVMPPGTLTVERRAMKNIKKPLYAEVKGKIDSEQGIKAGSSVDFVLTKEQGSALAYITKGIDNNKFGTTLLYGITGSGKTEVYLRAAKHAIEAGGSVIILVPEVGLTPQVIDRARHHFCDSLAVYYSNMTDKQRQDAWAEVATGGKKVVLGTRSALFMPLKDIKLIVLDEEYENTYKSDQSPRYHTREVAMQIAKRSGAQVVLGSATPSIETFYHAKNGDYALLTLPKRIDDKPLPPVEIIDMRKEIKSGNSNVLSRTLRDEIRSTYKNKEQSILFINRRGYFSFVMCRECGYIIKCPKCESSLIYHLTDKKLRCNHCSFTAEAATICPKCSSTKIKFFGGGTQRIEQEVASLIPGARILRLDRDTVSKKGSYENIIRSFISGAADVLIGTQMVTKGLDIGKVTLVGVVAADIGLNIPDFRAGEHTFQLITQVAGRAGRHKLAGKVIVQTYDPDNPAIKFASRHDYAGFYEEEIAARKELGMPPFENLINIIITSEKEKTAEEVAKDLARFLRKRLSDNGEVLGPAVAPISRLKGSFRYQILIKGKDAYIIRKAVVDSAAGVVKLGRTRIMIDVDPYSML